MNKAEELIACLEGEIAERDARIVELESDLAGTQSRVLSLQDQWRKLDAELAAIKAQEPVEYQLRALIRDVTNIPEAGYYMPQSWHDQVIALSLSGKLDAPVSEAKAQGVVLPDVNAAAKALCNRHAMICGVDADDQWKEYSQDFIADAETVLANARLNAAPVQQVSVPDERAAFEREDRYIVIKRSDMDRIPNQKVVHSFLGALGELSAHSVRIPQRKFLVIESDWPEYDPAWKLIQDRVQGRPILDAAPAAPALSAQQSAHVSVPAEDGSIFAGYLIDKCEGYEVSEENVQCWLSEMLADPHYGALFRREKQPHGMPSSIELAIEAKEEEHGSLRAAAKAIGVDAGYLSRLRNGEKLNPGDDVLAALGLERVVTYRALLNGGEV